MALEVFDGYELVFDERTPAPGWQWASPRTAFVHPDYYALLERMTTQAGRWAQQALAARQVQAAAARLHDSLLHFQGALDAFVAEATRPPEQPLDPLA